MWTNARFAGARRGGSLVQMEPSRALYRFAGALEPLLVAPDAAAFERAWDAAHLDRLAWEALALARRANSAALEPALHAVDRRLLAVLERCRSFLDPHLVTFRVPELERCQHAAAAALAGARWGVAGLRTVIADTAAPLGRRYFAFLALAEGRPLPLFEELLVTGHTDPDVERCEVTRALVAVRRLTGRVARSSKFADGDDPAVLRTLDDAERQFDQRRDRIVPVVVI